MRRAQLFLVVLVTIVVRSYFLMSIAGLFFGYSGWVVLRNATPDTQAGIAVTQITVGVLWGLAVLSFINAYVQYHRKRGY